MSWEVGKKIKKYRVRAKMTQTDLAKELGMSKSIISAYEKGTRNPSFDVLSDMAAIFNIPEVNFLLSEDDEDFKITVDITDLTDHQQYLIESLVRQFRLDNCMIKQNKKED